MKHYVFCGANIERNKLLIQAALKATEILEGFVFDLDNDCAGAPVHSKISINKEGPNTEICFENNDLSQLIKDCMQWAVEYHIQKEFLESLQK